MSILDFIAFILYTGLFSFLFSLQRKSFADKEMRRHHRNAFWLRIFTCFCYAMFVQYITGGGDTKDLYFPEGYNMFKRTLSGEGGFEMIFGPAENIEYHMLANPAQLGYFRDESNLLTIRIAALCSFLCFGKFMVVNLFFAMLAFSGIWKLYQFFTDQFPQLKKQMAIAILYLPTFTFWSSGILKDPIAVSALGWFTWALYELSVKKKNLILNSAIVLFTIYIFTVIKIYILVAYLPAFIIFLLLKNAQLLKNPLLKFVMILVFIGGTVFGFSSIAARMQDAVIDYAGEDVMEGIGNYQRGYQNKQAKSDGAYFSLGVEFDGTLTSLVKVAPMAVVATLYRPFLWESRNVTTLLSSFESLAMMLLTLYVLIKVGIVRFFVTIIKKPIVLYCLLFSISFALFVGATTLNFGTLVRYKIPCMPFYVVSLFLILYYDAQRKKTLQPVSRIALTPGS